tara:strand:+ start:624 stop:965 length:342 start_codon:yes stop_codon:yes gene_type:complete
MAGRTKRWQPPKGYTQCPKLKKLYDENGHALGRLYLWHPEQAIKAWSMLGGVLGPRWTLEVFRYWWIKENPDDYKTWRIKRLKRQERERNRAKRDRMLLECEHQGTQAAEETS